MKTLILEHFSKQKTQILLAKHSVESLKIIHGILFYKIAWKCFISLSYLLKAIFYTGLKKAAVFWFLSTVFFCNLSAQTRQYYFEKIGIEQGIPNGEVFQIIQDKKGFIWISTMNGIFRYDGYTFKPDPDNLLNDTSIPYLRGGHALLEDDQERIWGGGGYSIYRYDYPENHVSYYPFQKDSTAKNAVRNYAWCLLQDRQGKIWAGTNAGIGVYDPTEDRFQPIKVKRAEKLQPHQEVTYLIYQEKNGNYWVGNRLKVEKLVRENHYFRVDKSIDVRIKIQDIVEAAGVLWFATGRGLYNLNEKESALILYPLPENLRTANLTCLTADKFGQLWIGTLDQGLICLNLKTGRTRHFTREPDNPLSLGSDLIKSMTIDRQNNLWIGTYSGLNVLSLAPNFPLFQQQPGLGRPQNIVYRIHEDAFGGIWFSTRNRKLFRSPGIGTVAREVSIPKFPGQETHITNFYNEGEERIWMATVSEELGNFIFDFKQETITRVLPKDPNLLPACSFMEEDWQDSNYIWLGNREGLFKMDKRNRSYEQFSPKKDLSHLSQNGIQGGLQMKGGEIWLAYHSKVLHQLGYFDKRTGRFDTINMSLALPRGSSSTNIRKMIRGQDQDIWLATSDGLGYVDCHSKTFRLYRTEDGLAEIQLNGLALDGKGYLWIKSPRYISRYDVEKQLFKHFRVGPEMQELNVTSSDVCADGRILFGGNNGIYAFYPDSVKIDSVPPQVYLTEVKIGDRKKKFDHATELVDGIEIDYSDRIVEFEFVGIHYLDSKANLYRYKLEGFDQDWKAFSKKRTATYTNLSPGAYTFRVQAANAHGIWNRQHDLHVKLTVLPPWWQTYWAYALWICLTGFIVYSIYRFQKKRWQLQTNLQLEQQEAARLKELDQTKSRLFTNITHEFRTPLTVIQGMAEELEGNVKEGKELIKRNTEKLLTLINQMLDLAKLESGNLPLNYRQEDIILYLNYITFSFQSVANAKYISLSFQPFTKEYIMDFDREKVGQVLSNLLSNALKFTPEYGYVTVKVAKTTNALQIQVIDTGIGLAKPDQLRIFDRFQQVDSSSTRQREGTGIGLALVKELVHLMDGQIAVESELEKGSTFTVTLPITRNEARSRFKVPDQPETQVPDRKDSSSGLPVNPGEGLPRLLIIEDNRDILVYLDSLLQNHYSLFFARNGDQGIQMAVELVPDIIICDVMMPHKNGYEVTDILKKDRITSHIPIVMLTAKGDQESKEAGLQAGADAYLIKPFARKELFIRLQQLRLLREQLKIKYQNYSVEPIDPDLLAQDEELQFLEQLNRIVRAHLQDSSLQVYPHLCRLMTMSKSQLYRKVTALTGSSPARYVQKIRLTEARRLLCSTDKPVGLIAQEVGIADASYFARVYKSHFGVSPSATRNGIGVNGSNA